MTRISIKYPPLTTYKIFFSIVLHSVILIGYTAPNLVTAQQEQTTLGVSNESQAGNFTSVPAPQSQSQTPGQAQQGNSRTLGVTELQPNLDEPFVWSGLISSNIDGLPSPEDDGQSAVILPLRDDNALYAGTLTYQSNSPVDVTVWTQGGPQNNVVIPEDFGDTEVFGVVMNKTVVPIEVTSGTSGSVPFIGNALELVGDDEEPFTASYAVSAFAAQPELASNLTTLGNLSANNEEQGQ